MSEPNRRPSILALKSAYRDWLLSQVSPLAANSFALLTSIKGDLFWYFNEVVRDWPVERTADLLRAKIKQLSWGELGPLDLTTGEREVDGQFAWPALSFTATQVAAAHGHPVLTRQQQDLMALRQRIHGREFSVDRAQLRRRVSSALLPLTGRSVVVDGEYLFWQYFEDFDLTIETSVDYGRRALGQLVYQHSIYHGSVDSLVVRQERAFVRAISPANILGFHGYTAWNMLTPPDVETAITQVAGFVACLLRAIPSIVGLADAAG